MRTAGRDIDHPVILVAEMKALTLHVCRGFWTQIADYVVYCPPDAINKLVFSVRGFLVMHAPQCPCMLRTGNTELYEFTCYAMIHEHIPIEYTSKRSSLILMSWKDDFFGFMYFCRLDKHL